MMGIWVTRARVAAKIALAIAGAITVVAGSPRPTATPTLSTKANVQHRHFAHAQRREGVEVGIADFAGHELSALKKRHAEPSKRRAFRLGVRGIGIDDGASVRHDGQLLHADLASGALHCDLCHAGNSYGHPTFLTKAGGDATCRSFGQGRAHQHWAPHL